MKMSYFRIFEHPLLRILTSRLMLSGAGFLCGIGLAHILGPANLGSYSYIVSTASILSVLLSLGMDVPYNVHAARRPSAAANFLKIAGAYAFAVSAVAPIIWIAVQYVGVQPPGTPLLLLGAVFAMVLNQLTYSVSAGAQRQVQVNLALAALVLIQPAVVYLLTRVGLNALRSAIVAYIGVYTMVSAGSYLLLRSYQESGFPYRDTFRAIMLDGRHNLLSSVSGIVRLRAQIIILSMFVASAGVGAYQVSQTFVELLYLVPVSISTSILSLKSTDKALLKDSLRYSTVSIVITLASVLFLLLLMDRIIPVLYGARYASAIGYARVMLLGAVAFSVTKCLSSYLYKIGRGRTVAGIELGSTFVFLSVAPLMIRSWGADGAAWSFVLTSWLPALGYGFAVAAPYRQPKQPTVEVS